MTSTLTRRSSATTPTPQPRRRWRPPPEITAVATGLLVWWLCAGNVLPYLPSPASVVTEMTAAMSSPTLYESMAITLRRIVIAWGTGFLIALAVGVAMARNRYAEALAHPVVFIGLALPGPVTILFSTLWLGLGELAHRLAE